MRLSEVSSDSPKTIKLSQVQDLPKEKPFGERALEFIEPTVEALGTAGGAALGGTAGTFGAGPIGTAVGGMAGAGLGYGAAKEAMRGVRQLAGYEQPRTPQQTIKEPIQNILTGATYEAGGQALPGILQAGGRLGAGLGTMLTRTPQTRAAKIAGEALGENLPRAREILKSAADDISASQALSIIDPKTGEAVLNAPTAQALLKRAESRNPEFFTDLFGKQNAARIKELQQIAGGSNQTAAREAREKLKEELNKKLIPTLKTELEAANTAGKMKPKFAREAERMEEAARQKVEDVRRFTAAQPRAEAMARSALIEKGQPVGATKYTYIGGDIQRLAEKVAQDSAEGSLRFGDAARFARAAEQSLDAHGLKPLKGDAVIKQIGKKLNDPSLAGNADIRNSLIKVAEDIRSWTDKGGVIDAFALDSIRKNSVNAAIQKMYPAATKQQQKEIASKVVESVRPTIIDAVEDAGGTGYRQYLTDYAKGSQAIAQTKLGGELLGLYQTNPAEFVRVVEGNAPEKIEQVFGPGSYSIFKEMSSNTQKTLGKIAGEVKREGVASRQAEAGSKRLEDVLGTNLDFFRLPHVMTRGATAVNDAIARLEGKVSRDTLKALTEASKSAKNLDELLSLLPDKQRQEVVKRLTPSRTAGGVAAGLYDENQRSK